MSPSNAVRTLRPPVLRPACDPLDRLDRVLERAVVELDHVLLPARGPGEAPRQVHVDHVEAARAQAELDRDDVDDDLVALAHLPEQHLVGPGGTALAADLDDQRLGRDDDAAAQVQAAAHGAAATASTIPSHTSSIFSRLRAGTISSAVW